MKISLYFLGICNTILLKGIFARSYTNTFILIHLYNIVNSEMLAENIKKFRIKKGLSQEKLARLADISTVTLVKIESGVAKEPTITTVAKVAGALEVSIDKLVGKKSKNNGR